MCTIAFIKIIQFSCEDQTVLSAIFEIAAVHGPWDWANLRKSGVDFALSPVPGVGGNPGRPFVGVQTALLNRSTPNADLAVQFLEKYVCTVAGMKAMDADAPLGVPAANIPCR